MWKAQKDYNSRWLQKLPDLTLTNGIWQNRDQRFICSHLKKETAMSKENVQELMTENVRLREVLEEQFQKISILEKTILSLSCSDDIKKQDLLLKIIKAHPDCYTKLEFDEAFENASREATHKG